MKHIVVSGCSFTNKLKSLKSFKSEQDKASESVGRFHQRVKISTERLLAYAIPGKIIYDLKRFENNINNI